VFSGSMLQGSCFTMCACATCTLMSAHISNVPLRIRGDFIFDSRGIHLSRSHSPLSLPELRVYLGSQRYGYKNMFLPLMLIVYS
jgi:hypothetical protein